MSHWLRSHLSFFYHSKRKFTMVNGFSNVTGFSHFTMVNASLVCCVSNGGRMKAKFTIVKPSQKAWFIARLSKLCLFRWHLVMNFEKHFVTLLNLRAPPCAFDLFHAQSFDYQSSAFLQLLERSLPCPTTFHAVLGK